MTVDYREVQFTKAPAVLDAMAPEGVEKTEAARAEVGAQGPRERLGDLAFAERSGPS